MKIFETLIPNRQNVPNIGGIFNTGILPSSYNHSHIDQNNLGMPCNKGNKVMKTRFWIFGLIIAATMINGLLAGGNVDRALVAMPAWHQVGPAAWANFSRYADLGNGQIVYPLMAISGTLLSVITAGLFLSAYRFSCGTAWPISLAAALMLVALPISFKAAPFMLSLRHIGNENVTALAAAFAGFEFWGRLQGIVHLAAFCSNLWSLAAFVSSSIAASEMRHSVLHPKEKHLCEN